MLSLTSRRSCCVCSVARWLLQSDVLCHPQVTRKNKIQMTHCKEVEEEEEEEEAAVAGEPEQQTPAEGQTPAQEEATPQETNVQQEAYVG